MMSGLSFAPTTPLFHKQQKHKPYLNWSWQRSGSVVQRLTQDQGAACKSLTGITALCH